MIDKTVSSESSTLRWSDVEGAAELAFVGFDQPGLEFGALEWARETWDILIQAGLATYSTDDETERSQVVIRFLAVASFYLEFCSVAWEESYKPNYRVWADALEIVHFYARELISFDAEGNFHEDDEYELDDSDLQKLADNARKEVLSALLCRFGNLSRLFVVLWRSNIPEADGDGCVPYETDREILDFDETPKKQAAFEWLTQQCSTNSLEQTELPQIPNLAQNTAGTKSESIKKDVIKQESPFSVKTFDLLAQLHKKPTLDFYLSHEEEFKKYVEEPFHKLYRQVANRLPDEIAKQLDMKCEIFAYPNWNWYNINIYRQEATSTVDTQLFIVLERNSLFFGFFIGAPCPDKKRFLDNCLKNSEVKEILRQNNLNKSCELHGKNPVLKRQRHSSYTLEAWMKNPTKKNPRWKSVQASTHLSTNEVIQHSSEQLCDQITKTFDRFFPLVILAICDYPMPAIREYLNPNHQLSLPFSYQLNLSSREDKLREVSLLSNTTKLKPEYNLTRCAEDTNFQEAELERWVRVIERKKQAIFYGSPGTGKTFIAEKLAEHLIGGGDGFSELVQFHPAYSYEEFIQGIRPQSQDGALTYPLVSGRFLEFCEKAKSCEGCCALIIDEINRANLAQVFGELMYLLEYRDKKIRLAGSSKPFGIPENVRILGTMNTADRSIALVDHALRRRFAFIELRPNYEVLRRYQEKKKTSFQVDGLIETLERLNKAIADKHYEIGISFFLTENLADELEDIWQMEIEPYLEEYFFDQLEKVDDFRWDKIKQQVLP